MRRSAKKRGGRSIKPIEIGRMIPGRSLMRRKRLVSRIWLDKVLAGEREVQI